MTKMHVIAPQFDGNPRSGSQLIPESVTQVSCDRVEFDDPRGDQVVQMFVAEELIKLIPDCVSIISFDGLDGVGKSTLARRLSAELHLPIVELDSFLHKNKGRFLDALKLDQISHAIGEGFKKKGRLIVDGCQVEAALKRIGKSPDFRIYVMRTSRMQSGPEFECIDEFDLLYGGSSADELISQEEEKLRCFKCMPKEFGGGSSIELSDLTRELIRYHCETRPHDRADVIVKIVRTA